MSILLVKNLKRQELTVMFWREKRSRSIQEADTVTCGRMITIHELGVQCQFHPLTTNTQRYEFTVKGCSEGKKRNGSYKRQTLLHVDGRHQNMSGEMPV